MEKQNNMIDGDEEYEDVEVVVEEPEKEEDIPASRELENPIQPESFVGVVGEEEDDDDDETITKKVIEDAVLKNEICWSINGCSLSVRSAFQSLNDCEATATRLIKLFKVRIPTYIG